jgi:hypothetical protein
VLTVIGGSEASANPDGKTYTATITPTEVTAGVDTLFSLTVTNTSDSTPLGAVNLEVPIEYELTTDPVVVSDPDDSKSWSASFSGRTLELRANTSADRLGTNEGVVVTFGAIGLQEFIDSETYADYFFPIEARQANSFSGDPGNGLTYHPRGSVGPGVRVIGVAKHCTKAGCDLAQNLGSSQTGTFTLSGICVLDDCGVMAIDLTSDGLDLSTGDVVYTPAENSSDVRAFLTLSKTVLTQPPSQYNFNLYNDDGSLKAADLSKCRRGEVNCIEKIERTKADVTWIFRVDSEDPRMSW